ncbi:MAG: DUF6356 family protein [Pseudomonadota bacterium]
MIHRLFLAHPETVNETFLEHFRFALVFAGSLFAAACAAIVHAVIPCLFEKTASRIVLRLADRLQNRTRHTSEIRTGGQALRS